MGWEIIKASGWSHINLDKYTNKVCNWVNNTGLLSHVIIPGNATSIVLEKSIDGWVYSPHNMDNLSHVSAILGIMTYYLSEIESRITD